MNLVRLNVWTRSYRPFIMGGNVNAPVMTEVDAIGPYDLGKGMFGYYIEAPNGRSFIAESITGGIVGHSLEGVRKDVAEGFIDVIIQQIGWAKEFAKGCDQISEHEFWRLLGGLK